MIQGQGHSTIALEVTESLPSAAQKSVASGKRESPVLLVVDDNPVVLAWTKAQLKKRLGNRGYRVEVASSVRGAVDLLRTRREPHYVLLDLNMPVLSGEEAVREILPWGSVVKVITLSAMDPAEWKSRMIAAGAAAYVQKTADAEELTRAILAELPLD